jgi:hypothetical protein
VLLQGNKQKQQRQQQFFYPSWLSDSWQERLRVLNVLSKLCPHHCPLMLRMTPAPIHVLGILRAPAKQENQNGNNNKQTVVYNSSFHFDCFIPK